MPQEKSILAALHPENSKSLYFVAKGVSPKEGHSFSSTLDEHNRAVVSYRKKVAEYLKQQQIADSSQDELIEAENEAQNNNTGVSQDRNKNSSDKAKVASKTKSDDSKSDTNKMYLNLMVKLLIVNLPKRKTTRLQLKRVKLMIRMQPTITLKLKL